MKMRSGLSTDILPKQPSEINSCILYISDAFLRGKYLVGEHVHLSIHELNELQIS